MCPPCASTSWRAMANPNPPPTPSVRERAGSPRQKRSKMEGISSGAMPLPVSRTMRRTPPGTRSPCKVMVPPEWRVTQCIHHQVPEDLVEPPHVSVHGHPCAARRFRRYTDWMPFASACPQKLVEISVSNSSTAMASLCNTNCPDSARERSLRSSMRRASQRVSSSMALICSAVGW